jgi:hypothetical protein
LFHRADNLAAGAASCRLMSSLTPDTDKKGARPEGGGREAFFPLDAETRSSINFCRPFRAGPLVNVSWG